MRTRFSLFFKSSLIAIFATLLACKDNNTEVALKSISLDKTGVSIFVGETETILANFDPVTTTNKKIEWASSNPLIVSLKDNLDGTVTITGERVGTAVITLTYPATKKSLTCAVEIKERVISATGVKIEPKATVDLKLESGPYNFYASVEPVDAKDKSITLTNSKNEKMDLNRSGNIYSSDGATLVASYTSSVDGNLRVTIIVTPRAVGQGNLKVSSGKLFSDIVVNVISVALSTKKLIISASETEHFSFTATVKPDEIANKEVTFINSKDESVVGPGTGDIYSTNGQTKIATYTATADANGLVTVDVKGMVPGSGSLIAKMGLAEDQIEIVVGALVASQQMIEIASDLSPVLGGNLPMTFTISPEDAMNKTIVWKNSMGEELTTKIFLGSTKPEYVLYSDTDKSKIIGSIFFQGWSGNVAMVSVTGRENFGECSFKATWGQLEVTIKYTYKFKD